MVLFRLEDKPYRFAKLQIIQTLLNISLVVLLVIILRWGAVGKICATVFSLVIMALFHLYLLIKRRYIVRILDKVSLKVLLKFGIPLLPHSLSFWIKSGMDKVLLTNFCGLSINGLYSMAMSLGAIFSIFTTAFTITKPGFQFESVGCILYFFHQTGTRNNLSIFPESKFQCCIDVLI